MIKKKFKAKAKRSERYFPSVRNLILKQNFLLLSPSQKILLVKLFILEKSKMFFELRQRYSQQILLIFACQAIFLWREQTSKHFLINRFQMFDRQCLIIWQRPERVLVLKVHKRCLWLLRLHETENHPGSKNRRVLFKKSMLNVEIKASAIFFLQPTNVK